jgi:uncharacterized protein (TIGR02271 family)
MTNGSTPQRTDPDDGAAHAAQPDYLVRSEEQLRIRTEKVIAGHARLEKFTVTETRTVTVEVTHEEVRLVHRAPDGSVVDEPTPAGAAADSARWMVLSREEVVVSKRVVPFERVRLEVYPVVEQQQVTEQVRKEQIDDTPETHWAATQHQAPLG